MKKIFPRLFILCYFVISCSNVLDEQNIISPSSIVSEEQNAQKEFAIILSKALRSDSDLRVFVKQEALKRFDNDYDVFYPNVKDVLINGKDTFREILLSYSEDYESFSYLESTLEKLTLLVPDWSWITSDCFSVKNWDTSDNFVCVGYDDGLEEHSVYYNGELFDIIKSSEVTCYPVVIVKSNERIRVVSPATKGSAPRYEFICDAFDGSKRIPDLKASVFEHDLPLNDDNSNFVPSSDLPDHVIASYDEFGTSWQNATQRDYIYYGMSKSKTTNGIPNTFIRERLYRIKVNPTVLSTIKGPIEQDEDPDMIRETTILGQTEGNDYLETIKNNQRKLWAEGAYEFNIQAFIGENRMPYGFTSMNQTISILPEQLWFLNHTKVTRSLKWFKYKFEFDPRDLESKWYYLSQDDMYLLPYWDLSAQSYRYWFTVSEWDLSSTSTEERQMSYSYTDNFKVTVGSEVDIPIDTVKLKLTLGLDYTSTRTDVEKTTTTVSISNTGYSFGQNFLDYSSNIISSGPATNKNGLSGYYVNNITVGDVVLTLFPEDVRY